MKPTKPPFRADHVGSLLRPRQVLDAREDHRTGRIAATELRTIEDGAIRQAVRMQDDIGLQGITDGEYRRGSWHMDFLYQVGGVSKAGDNLTIKFRNEKGEIEAKLAAFHIAGKLTLPKCIFGEDFEFLKSVTQRTPKLTIPSPSMMHYCGGRSAIDEVAYPDLEEFWRDLGQVYAEQIESLGKLGCTYLQIDDTSLAYLNDPAQRDYITKLGGNGEHQHLTYIQLINAALSKKPPEMTVCTHLCRGNFRSSWVASGGYDYVAEALFGELKVDGFFLEYDDARSGGFQPLRFVPRGRRVVLGLVSTKTAALERKDDLKRRIDEAAKYVPQDHSDFTPLSFSAALLH
jgi:5-methyltetrahydropteroyltriglutamate--homocysteine methyltransferase